MKNKGQIALRMVGWLLLAGITLEVCARTEDKVRYGADWFGNYSIETLFWNAPEGRSGRPNSSYLKWHLNEAGLRGPTFRNGTYRIVCMGSSETFGMYESPEHEWPRRLEEMLNDGTGAQRYEVIDGAYPGMSVATNLRRLPQTVARLRPQMVVVYPSYTPYIEIDHPLDLNATYVATSAARTHRSFEWRISGRLQDLMKRSVPESLQGRIRAWQTERAARGTETMDRLPEQNVQAFRADLDRLTSQLRAQGIEVVLVTHTNRFGGHVTAEERPVLIAWRKFFPTLKEDGFLDMEQRMSDAVRQIGVQRGVPVVDAASIVAPGKKNFVEFVHFTDAGASALAAAVSTEVKREARSGMLPGAPR